MSVADVTLTIDFFMDDPTVADLFNKRLSKLSKTLAAAINEVLFATECVHESEKSIFVHPVGNG